jgi:type III pantothenate kinase
MMLLVDAGNTRIKWRIVSGRTLQASGVVLTANVADLAQAWLPHRLTGAVLSCVADAAAQAGLVRLMAELGLAAQWLLPEREKYGLINLYDVPEKLGADRYAALIAAARLKLGDCVVVSVGTATTVDMLSRNNEFLGGVIIPGPDLMRAALLGGTGQIEVRMQGDAPSTNSIGNPLSLPRNTDTAVGMGIALAQAGVVRALCERMPVVTEPPLVILTGGARAQIRGWLDGELIEIEDLVLEGLAWIALESAREN